MNITLGIVGFKCIVPGLSLISFISLSIEKFVVFPNSTFTSPCFSLIDFIESLPLKYESKVGERGVMLSGGERQRVAIARAILKNAPILVLDEATSALDSQSERYIQESLEQLMIGKTVIAIAHRLSTLHEMDEIIVFEKGKIVERGSHNELYRKGGQYAKFYKIQAGLEKNG